MSEKPLTDRIIDAVQARRENTLLLQALADEFVELAARMRVIDDAMQSYATTLDTPGRMKLPRALSSGPQRPKEEEAA